MTKNTHNTTYTETVLSYRSALTELAQTIVRNAEDDGTLFLNDELTGASTGLSNDVLTLRGMEARGRKAHDELKGFIRECAQDVRDMHDQTAALFDRWVRTDAELRMNVDVDAEHWPETEASSEALADACAREREAEEDCSEDAFSDALTRALRLCTERFILTRLSDVIFERHKHSADSRRQDDLDGLPPL